MRRTLVPILLALAPAAAAAQPFTFLNGDLSGLRAERAPGGGIHFLPGVVEARPAPSDQQEAINSIVQHIREGADPSNVSIVARPNPTTGDSHTAFRSVIAACQMEQPYRLTAVAIRVGWVCDGRLEWFAFFNFSNNQFPYVLLARAIVPPIPPAPAPPSGARQ